MPIRDNPSGVEELRPVFRGGELRVARGGALLPPGHETAVLLRAELPWTAPSRVPSLPKTFGTGDRLGLASPGHIRCFEGSAAAPVLAQQSLRELGLTGRSYEDVLDAATFAVFREGFKRPWGFDGDHLKTPEEIGYALKSGCTMLTLDCSEKLGGGGEPTAEQRALYLGGIFEAGGAELRFGEAELNACAAACNAALDFVCRASESCASEKAPPDLELSLDEAEAPTTPLLHFFVASELRRRGAAIQSLAPRFGGAFEKGVDYAGDLKEFERELVLHEAVARRFGHKLSLHSGSDKFSVFPLIARHCGAFHVKTSGTSWLEALRLAAARDPALFRLLYAEALAAFPEAKKLYKVSVDMARLPDVPRLPDSELPSLLDDGGARQLLHIAYGRLLRSACGGRLLALLRGREEDYFALLRGHIGRHLEALGL
jgi:hypothetical protein